MKVFLNILIILIFFSLPLHSDTITPQNIGDNEDDIKPWIRINVPAFSIKLIKGDKVLNEWRCRVGKNETKTILGEGYITRKFNPTYFRYSKGTKEGEIIEYSRIRKYHKGPVLLTIKIPYEKSMRGLELKINGRISGQIIHSTTNPETIGHVYSNGCLGMYEDDMLELFDLAETGTKVRIVYEPVEFDGEYFYFHRDIYKRDPDMINELHNKIVSLNLPITRTMERLLLIKGLSKGKISITQFLKEFNNN